MAVFSHEASPAVYIAVVCSGPSSITTAAGTTVLVLARLNAETVSVIGLLPGKDFRGGWCLKDYSDAFRKFLYSATSQVVRGVHQLAKYWYPKRFQAETKRNSTELRKKLVFDMFRSARRMLVLPSLSTAFLGIDAHWLSTVVCEDLGDVSN